MYEKDYIIHRLSTSNQSYGHIRDEFNELSIEGLWDKLKKIRKDTTPIILFGAEPFSSNLRTSNIKEYKYDWIWEKSAIGFLNSKKMPMKVYENVSIFYKSLPIYNPQNLIPCNIEVKRGIQKNTTSHDGGRLTTSSYNRKFTNYPTQKLVFKNEKGLHQTQKPVALMEYLIKTYTNENELILDFTSGSGTTAVACENTNRRWICIEKDEDSEGNSLGYCDITVDRLKGVNRK